jgi:hypothetical protein
MKPLFKFQIRAIKKLIGYRGRTVRTAEFKPGMSVNSYWDSGSRDYWYLINRKTFAMREIPQNGTPFDKLSLTCDHLNPEEILVLKPCVSGKVRSIIIFS